MLQSRELRVFISSTFRDLVEEREQLTRKVFPALRALCRERGVEFTEIDLRWGLTDEEAHNGKIIRTCFEEIDVCRPYFIGIIGSRYGWAPPFAEIQKDPMLMKRYPWVEDAALAGASILEMEFDHGALRNPEAAEHTFFYLRRERTLSHRYADHEVKDVDERLARLRERVRASGLPCKEYNGAETLGEMIYDDLLAVIDKNWSPAGESALDHERYQHAAFAASRRQAYIANPERIRRLTNVVRDEKKSLVIEAPSGSGKSALLAYWSHHFRESNPKTFVIEHYVGVGNDAGDGVSIALRIIREIAQRYELADELPAKPDDAPAQLPFWLARIAEPCVILLDAVNQLDKSSRTLAWLPEPQNVQFVVSTTDPETAAALASRGWERVSLEPLTEMEREAIIIRYLNEYHKSLSIEQSKRMASDAKCSSPLFLRTMLEEMRLGGSHKHLDAIIGRYLGAKNTDELFQLVLERLEEDFGSRTVRELMSLIWASRDGLTHRELSELMPVTSMRLSEALLALDYHLQRNAGLLTFFHEYLRHAVEARYLDDDEKKTRCHVTIAEYMGQQPATERHASEEAWQWRRANNWDRLTQCIFKKEIFLVLSGESKMYELSQYWESIASTFKGDTLKPFLYESEQYPDRITLLNRWAEFLTYVGNYEVAISLYQHAITIAKDHGDEHTIFFTTLLQGLASIYFQLHRIDAAEEQLTSAIDIKQSLLGSEHESLIPLYSDLGAVKYSQKKYEEATSIFKRCIELCTQHYGFNHPETAKNLNNLASIEYMTGHTNQALDNFKKAYEIIVDCKGVNTIDSVSYLVNIGTLHNELHQSSEARACFEKASVICSSILPPQHPLMAKINNLQGIIEFRERLFLEALKHFQKAYGVRLSLFGKNHGDTLSSQVSIGRTYLELGESALAIETFREVATALNESTARLELHTIDAIKSALPLLEQTAEEYSAGGIIELLKTYITALPRLSHQER